MAQPITASFITDTGFASGLAPTVEISLVDWTVIGSFPMIEGTAGNYVYMFDGYNPDVVYFFKYDANDDNVINRYQANNNNTPSVLYQMAWGTNAKVEDTKKKEKDLIEKISKEVKKELEEWYIKQMETLGLIVENTDLRHIELRSSTILSSIENNSKDTQKSITSIKIPTYDESKLVKAIKDIPTTDIKPIMNILTKIDSCCEYTEEEVDKVKWLLMAKYDIKDYINKEESAKELIKELIEDESILESLQD